MSWQMAIIAQYTDALAPEATRQQKKADWIKWSHEWRPVRRRREAAGAAKADDKAVKAAWRKIDDNAPSVMRCSKINDSPGITGCHG